jgi:hypothetical protein
VHGQQNEINSSAGATAAADDDDDDDDDDDERGNFFPDRKHCCFHILFHLILCLFCPLNAH